MCPKVSVIVPIYNAEHYLKECIESVLNQTLRDLELILIDDGSTDHSLQICSQYIEKDCRIQVFSNENIGQGLERNFGIKKAKGEYIAFLDSDDKYEKNMLENLYNQAISEKADMVSGGYLDIKDGKIIAHHPLENMILDDYEDIKSAMLDLISYEKKDGYSGCIAVWDSIFKKEIITENNIKFCSERDVYSEDLLFKLQVMSCAKKIVYSKEMLYEYRVTDVSFTNKINGAVLDRIVRLHNEICLQFGRLLGSSNLKKRITNRTFFTLRFNIKKIAKFSDAEMFYQMITGNTELMDIIMDYEPCSLKNLVIWSLIRQKKLGILRWIARRS